MAASVISARDGTPVFARFSSTCVAQITGTCAASANPQNLFLDLRHPLVSAFDGEIATGDHHAEAPGPHAGQQQPRQFSKAPRVSIFRMIPRCPPPSAVEVLLQLPDIIGASHE